VEAAIVKSFTLPNTCKKERKGRLQTHLAYHKKSHPSVVRNRHTLKSVRHTGQAKWENSFIIQNEKKSTKDCMVWSSSQVKEGGWETRFLLRKMPKKSWFTFWIVLKNISH
jgi:hypothetical protein